jgi:hypothetical protein
MYAVSGVRSFRKGNIGPALIDIQRSMEEDGYKGIALNDPSELWVCMSPMSWNPRGVKGMWPEKDLEKCGSSERCRPSLSSATKQLLMLLKTHIVVHQTSLQDLFSRCDNGRAARVLKSRIPAMGLSASAADLQHLCDDFAEYITYKPILEYVDALDVGDDELRSVSVSASNATIDREVSAMLTTFREKLLTRRRSPRDAFKGCATGGIPQSQFRERLATLGLVLMEGDIQKLMRRYRCNLWADVDWDAFCRGIESSRTINFGTHSSSSVHTLALSKIFLLFGSDTCNFNPLESDRFEFQHQEIENLCGNEM